MQFERTADQADGLRRLLMRASPRVVTVAAARSGLGATSVVVNLATALAQAGKDVLVLDENISHDNVANTLALRPRYDLLHAVRHDKPWREIMLHTHHGVRILPVARAIQALPKLFAPERERLLECLTEASRNADLALIDTAICGNRYISAGIAPDQPLLLVLNTTASAITESYAMIKNMALHDGRRNFEIVVNKARDDQKARALFGNLAQAARQHLNVHVEYLGYIPDDEKLRRAAQLCRSVVEAFPTAPAAIAFVELGSNLSLLPAAGDEETAGLRDLVQRLMRRSHLPAMV